MNKILNASQASAVADAMCALNNVSGIVDIRLENDITVLQIMYGAGVCVANPNTKELYETQKDFMAAYGV